MQAVAPDTAYQLFVGIDIAATTATVSWQTPDQKPGKPITIEQTPEGFSSLHQRLLRTGVTPAHIPVVMEATGIYWLALATFFTRQGYAVSVVNPAQAHHFAKALLKPTGCATRQHFAERYRNYIDMQILLFSQVAQPLFMQQQVNLSITFPVFTRLRSFSLCSNRVRALNDHVKRISQNGYLVAHSVGRA